MKKGLILLFCTLVFISFSIATPSIDSQRIATQNVQEAQESYQLREETLERVNIFLNEKENLRENYEMLGEQEKQFIKDEVKQIRERWEEQRRLYERDYDDEERIQRKSCNPEDREVEVCITQYDPVCGYKEDGTKETYSNSCFACKDSEVTRWIPGECEEQEQEYIAHEFIERALSRVQYRGQLKEVIEDEDKIFVRPGNSKRDFLISDIRILPEVAASRAMEQLQLNCEEQNCTVDLIETGRRNKSKLAYELQSKQRVRLFGLIDLDMKTRTQIDTEQGEILDIKRPWWAFLARE